jgi:hypothetical protein
MDEQKRRIGVNEAVFREANERIEDLNEAFATVTDELVLVCECGDGECMEKISLTREEYEELRADPTQFAVVPGHEKPTVEEVVARRKGYDVVRKVDGIPRRIAELTDPR